MSEPKFTLGPWKWINQIPYGQALVSDNEKHEGIVLEVTGSGDLWFPNEGGQYDACLIRAAPELYDALEAIAPPETEEQYRHNMADAPCHNNITTIDGCRRCQRNIAAIRALVKARGEEQ